MADLTIESSVFHKFLRTLLDVCRDEISPHRYKRIRLYVDQTQHCNDGCDVTDLLNEMKELIKDDDDIEFEPETTCGQDVDNGVETRPEKEIPSADARAETCTTVYIQNIRNGKHEFDAKTNARKAVETMVSDCTKENDDGE